MSAALYNGIVTHRRLLPVAHALRYNIFMLLLDLDSAPSVARRLRLFGFDRPGLLSFYQRDHGDGSATGLRAWVDGYLRDGGFATSGAIRILSMPRVLGHGFNPLTLFFCHAPDGALQAILYEVNNTFGQRHCYLLRVPDAVEPVVQDCAKMFHVSPFMAMDLQYRFRVRPPGDRVAVFITARNEAATVLTASFAGTRQELTDRALALAALRMPVLGLKVLVGIHWEAAKLWLKGLKLQPTPAAPASAVTIGP